MKIAITEKNYVLSLLLVNTQKITSSDTDFCFEFPKLLTSVLTKHPTPSCFNSKFKVKKIGLQKFYEGFVCLYTVARNIVFVKYHCLSWELMYKV